MEQQLEKEIKKNKNLLQSNFALMQENDTLITALTRFKNFLRPGADPEETIHVDDVDELVTEAVLKIEQAGLQANAPKACQCEKWKQLYAKESEESYRLSQKLSESEEKANRLEQSMQADQFEMQNILKEYLIMFQKVRSVEFIQKLEEHKKPIDKEIKQKQNKKGGNGSANKNSVTDRSAHSRSKSKQAGMGKHTAKKTHKQDPMLSVSEQLQGFPSFISYLDSLQSSVTRLTEQVSTMRAQCMEKQSLVRGYRKRERQRLMGHH